jgi:hypothetical protein
MMNFLAWEFNYNMISISKYVVAVLILLDLVETVHHLVELVLLELPLLLEHGVEHDLPIQSAAFTQTEVLEACLHEVLLGLVLPLRYKYTLTNLLHLVEALLLELVVLLAHVAELPLLDLVLVVVLYFLLQLSNILICDTSLSISY